MAVATGTERIAQMQALLPSAKSFDNTIHLSPELGFVFFSNPIVACSTLKATLNQATARALDLPAPVLRLDAIHDRDANPLQRPSDIGLTRFAEMLDDPAIRKIAFVRDPLGRFMSCFGKKLSRENRITERVRARMNVPASRDLNEFLTPDSFAAAIEADPRLLNMNDHWRPQRRQVFYDLVPDLQLGRIESFAADVDRLLTPIFGIGGYQVIDVPALFPQNSSRTRGTSLPALSEAGLAAVRRVYADDFVMLTEANAASASRRAAAALRRLRPAPDPARPELILHVGMSAAGGSVIAAALEAVQPAADRAINLGPSPLLARGMSLNDALDQPPARLKKLGAGWAARLATQARAEGALRLIVSNDRLAAHPQAMAALLAPLADRFALRVVILARDPRVWLAEAALDTVRQPDALEKLVRQYGDLLIWQDLFGDTVEICAPGDGDMIAAAAGAFGITLLPAALRAPDPAARLVQTLLAAEGDPPDLAQVMQSLPTRARIDAAIAAQVGIFDAITERGGPDLLALNHPPATAPQIEAVRARLLEALLARTSSQAARIEVLEARIAALQPVAPRGRKT